MVLNKSIHTTNFHKSYVTEMLLIGQLFLNFCILEFENAMGYKGNYVKVFFSFCTFNEEIIRTIDKQGKYYMHKFIKYWLMRL